MLSLKKCIYFSSVILFFALLTSCYSGKDISCSDILSEMSAAAGEMPSGRVYRTDSTPGASDYLSPSLLTALYGNGELPPVLTRVKSEALRASSGLFTCELAVFECNSRRDTEEVADLCLYRLDTIRHFLNLNSEKLGLSDKNFNAVQNGRVEIAGKYVFMAVCEDSEKAIRAAKAFIS